ncbi:MAG: exo-alpha-sialidase [Candidatus Hodarchaeota archaeon]
MKNQPVFEEKSLDGASSCHSSSIIALPDNRLFATWWAGTREKATDVAIWGAYLDLKDPSPKWSGHKIIANTPGKFNGTPVLYLDPDDNLFLFYRSMHHSRLISGGHTTTTIRYQMSKDLGETWGNWKFLWKWWFLVIRCKPLKLPSGRVLLPLHREAFTYQSKFFINDDPYLNDKWRIVGRLNVPGGCLEPSITLTKSGKILCALRAFKAKRVYLSTSEDEGLTWSKPEATDIPNPNSQVDILTLRNGHLLMCCNPVERKRDKLSLIRSVDEGKTWDIENMYILENAEKTGNFSYPCMIQLEDGTIHVTYSWYKKEIHHVTFKEEECFP